MNDREQFWAGEFGNDYNRRSPGDERSNYHFFEVVLNLGVNRRRPGQSVRPASILELGCGTGANLRALRSLIPGADLAGVEINAEALDQAMKYPSAANWFHHGSILDWTPPRDWELAFTKGMLIHIAPEDLPAAYDTLWAASHRYILVAEYYNPVAVEVPYRGHARRLWKRDFAGDLMKRFDLQLLDYGFVYHGDPYPQDDINWFLLEKRGEHGKPTAAT